MKVTLTRGGGPVLGPKHPSNQDPTLEAHAYVIDTLAIPAGEGHSDYRFRWRCACSRAGAWHSGSRSRRARSGGARHVAAMERGR